MGFEGSPNAQLAAEHTNGDGIREDKKGHPISLRLWALAESTSTQAEGKLITGWFNQLGLKIDFQVVDNGAASDAMYAYNDPGSTLQCCTTSQIGYWNEVYWSNAEFDKLCEQQGVELDPQKRADLIYRMQQVMYANAPRLRAP